MSAATFILTNTPQQEFLISTKPVYMQEIRGRLTRFTCTPTQPNPAAVTSCVILNNDVSITQGFPIWAWTTGDEIQLSVLKGNSPP